jgi:hypothetical protein
MLNLYSIIDNWLQSSKISCKGCTSNSHYAPLESKTDNYVLLYLILSRSLSAYGISGNWRLFRCSIQFQYSGLFRRQSSWLEHLPTFDQFLTNQSIISFVC